MLDLMSSDCAKGLIHIPVIAEPSIEQATNCSKDGVFIGNSYHYNIPIFLDFGELLNPHILICGMTGGGKTYFAKSLLVRMHLFSDASVIVIDFTGEYGEAVSNLTAIQIKEVKKLFYGSVGVVHYDFHELPELDKARSASELLDYVAKLMRGRGTNYKNKVFVLLDEAWKLVEDNKGLEIIIREGRKYGVGLITSSQLLHDTNTNILSNIATIFVFKTTNTKSLERISKSYNLSEKEACRIQNLDLGSCLLIRLHKTGIRSALVIRRVIGVKDTNQITLSNGEKMERRISVADFDGMMTPLCGIGKLRAIKEAAKEN